MNTCNDNEEMYSAALAQVRQDLLGLFGYEAADGVELEGIVCCRIA